MMLYELYSINVLRRNFFADVSVFGGYQGKFHPWPPLVERHSAHFMHFVIQL